MDFTDAHPNLTLGFNTLGVFLGAIFMIGIFLLLGTLFVPGWNVMIGGVELVFIFLPMVIYGVINRSTNKLHNLTSANFIVYWLVVLMGCVGYILYIILGGTLGWIGWNLNRMK